MAAETVTSMPLGPFAQRGQVDNGENLERYTLTTDRLQLGADPYRRPESAWKRGQDRSYYRVLVEEGGDRSGLLRIEDNWGKVLWEAPIATLMDFYGNTRLASRVRPLEAVAALVDATVSGKASSFTFLFGGLEMPIPAGRNDDIYLRVINRPVSPEAPLTVEIYSAWEAPLRGVR